MSTRPDRDVDAELHDVFQVRQVTRASPLESVVAADLVRVEADQESTMHRDNNAETVLYFLSGRGEVLLTEDYEPVPVETGDRLLVGKGVFHAVRTADAALEFLSVQSPPILDLALGTQDLEPLR